MLLPERLQDIEVRASVIRTRKRRGRCPADLEAILSDVDDLLRYVGELEKQNNYLNEQYTLVSGKLTNLENQSQTMEILQNPSLPE